MSIINENFMLKGKTAKLLYHDFAENLPIIDYHCHISPAMIAENYQFKNAYDLFLGGDHYKWRLMRTNGIDEEYITGCASDFEKWEKFAETVPLMIGNPMYHWSHLELKRYFGIDEALSPKTAEKIWNIVGEKLSSADFRAKNIIENSNVKVICTTDNPYDDLEYHKAIKADSGFKTKVLPTFRPDLSDIRTDITERMDYFHQIGCRLSDHSLDRIDEETSEKLIFLGREYAKRGWTMQLHIGAMRNNNSRMFEKIGADTGFDSINDFRIAEDISKILNSLEKDDALPKTILYTLNPKDNYVLATMLGNFQKAPFAGKIQFGSGWWFNDNRDGMEEHLRSVANLSLLPRFVGMLTDSRSFVSYTRHEYFRRIFCNLIGTWVDDGEYPRDTELLGQFVRGVCFENADKYFGF